MSTNWRILSLSQLTKVCVQCCVIIRLYYRWPTLPRPLHSSDNPGVLAGLVGCVEGGWEGVGWLWWGGRFRPTPSPDRWMPWRVPPLWSRPPYPHRRAHIMPACLTGLTDAPTPRPSPSPLSLCPLLWWLGVSVWVIILRPIYTTSEHYWCIRKFCFPFLSSHTTTKRKKTSIFLSLWMFTVRQGHFVI